MKSATAEVVWTDVNVMKEKREREKETNFSASNSECMHIFRINILVRYQALVLNDRIVYVATTVEG